VIVCKPLNGFSADSLAQAVFDQKIELAIQDPGRKFYGEFLEFSALRVSLNIGMLVGMTMKQETLRLIGCQEAQLSCAGPSGRSQVHFSVDMERGPAMVTTIFGTGERGPGGDGGPALDAAFNTPGFVA
jgi:hypothetical protein